MGGLAAVAMAATLESLMGALIQEKNIATGLTYKVAKLGEVDDSGRRSPVDTGIEKSLKSNLIIEALGFQPENINEKLKTHLDLTGWDTIKVDFNRFQTSNPKVFAAGDIVRGASLVVWAIHDGREAAKKIKNFLSSNNIKKAS